MSFMFQRESVLEGKAVGGAYFFTVPLATGAHAFTAFYLGNRCSIRAGNCGLPPKVKQGVSANDLLSGTKANEKNVFQSI